MASKPGQNCDAEAFAVWRQHGERAPHFVAEHIRALAMADDIAGVKRWQRISAELTKLMHGDDRETLNMPRATSALE